MMGEMMSQAEVMAKFAKNKETFEVLAPPHLQVQVMFGFFFSMALWSFLAFLLPSILAATPWVAIVVVIVGVSAGMSYVGTSHSAYMPQERIPWVVFFAASGALLFQVFKVSVGAQFGSDTFLATLLFALCSAAFGTFSFSC